jgi:hypothetical protein
MPDVALASGINSHPSISPRLMPNRQLVQFVLMKPPRRHELVHQTDEAVVVRGLQQMNHLVHDDILQTFRWLLGQIGIEPDALGRWTTATPFRLHPLHEEALHFHVHHRLPLRDQRRDGLFDRLAVPLFQKSLPLCLWGRRSHLEPDLVVIQLDFRCGVFLGDPE